MKIKTSDLVKQINKKLKIDFKKAEIECDFYYAMLENIPYNIDLASLNFDKDNFPDHKIWLDIDSYYGIRFCFGRSVNYRPRDYILFSNVSDLINYIRFVNFI